MVKNLSLLSLNSIAVLFFFIVISGSGNSISANCNLPAGLTTVNVTANTAQCFWAATVCDSFLLRYNVTGSSNYFYKTISSGTATNTTLTGLNPSTSYSWVVRTYCNNGSFGGYQSTPAQFTTIAGPLPGCNLPVSLTTTGVTSNSATFNWASTLCDSFLVRYNVTGSTNYLYKTVKPGTSTITTVTGLTPQTSYSWVIRTYCNNGASGGYQPVAAQFTTLAGPAAGCNLPSGLSTSNITYNSAICNWSNTVCDSFLLRYNVTGTSNYLYKKVVHGTATSTAITGLNPSTSYSWVIRTYCNNGSFGGYQSVPAQFTTPAGPQPCRLPTGLNTTSVTSSSAQLRWTATTCDSFLVRYNVNGSTLYTYRTVKPGTATSVTINGLYPSTNYRWVIHTYCNGGTSGPYQAVAAQFTTLNGPMSCVIPNNLATSSIGPNSAVISWNSAIVSDSFLIRYALRNTTLYTWVKVPGNLHSYTIPYLSPNTAYDWSVRSVCASTPVQAYSTTSTFTTSNSSCGSTDPTYFGSSAITNNSAVVGWLPVSGAVSYNVRYSVRYANTWITLNTTTNSRTLTGLQASKSYEFQVQVVCSGSAGPWSTSGLFQTAGSTLTLTRGPYLQQSTPSSIFIRWRTDFASNSRVRYGTTPTNLNLLKDDALVTNEHVVQLTGLTANTKYYYSIGSSTITLQGDTGNYFLSNPPVGSTGPVRIWTIGDFGVNTTGQRQVRDSYMNYANSANTNVWLWVGDNAYADGTDAEYSSNVFAIYPYQMKKWVIWPATGNHDLHSANAFNQTGPYFDIFTLPKQGEVGGLASGTEAYYSFNYANIHFVCLESTDAAFRANGGAMATWLANDLAANTQRWTIVYFHHPPYSKGSHNSDTETELIEMRTNINPILENYKVDLVLTGHSHSYERSMMIKGHFGNEASFNATTMAVNSGSGIFPASYTKTSPLYSGTVYVVCGVSGQIGGTSSGWPHNAMYSSSVGYFGSLVIDVTGDRLDCKFLTHTSIIFDQFTIQKTGIPYKYAEVEPAVATGDLLEVFPNPVTYESTLRYMINESSNVKIEIVDIAGRVVSVLNDGEQAAGEHLINISKSSENLHDGIYFIRMQVGDQTIVRKFIVSE